MEKDLEKKYLIIKRKACIGCGACVVASDNKCYFLDGKSWCHKVPVENAEEVIDVCPVCIIEAATKEEYEKAEQELIDEGVLTEKE